MSNTLYAETFVTELVQAGLQAVCIAPGSRSTPLTLAFAKNRQVKVYSHLDERSMAFFALGLALASDKPVALVCTSGTAGANFYPAVIEAHQSRVPLIVITADRPPELRYSGANQTIDQIKLYGDFVLGAFEVGLPEEDPPDVAIRNLRTLAARVYLKANAIRKGVVHVNMPFRKPLEPTDADRERMTLPARYTRITKLAPTLEYRLNVDVESLEKLIRRYKRGLVICGPRWTQTSNPSDVYGFLDEFSDITGYPVLADPISGVRFAQYMRSVSSYETILTKVPSSWRKPEIVLRFGNVPTSKWLNAYLEAARPNEYLLFGYHGEWSDDAHLATEFIMVDEGEFLADFIEKEFNPADDWRQQFVNADRAAWAVIEEHLTGGDYFDGGVVYDVVDLIPSNSTLFVGNSLPVRHLDQFGKPTGKGIHVYANRGASGIDGNISTALGTGAANPNYPLVAILGDVTFYHDMNGLLAVRRAGIPITIVLLNNDGGGIFHRLPVRDYDPTFTDLFVTPHGLDYEHAAKLYGMDFVRIDGHGLDARKEFREAFNQHVGQSTIIEVRTDAQRDLARRNEIIRAVQQRL